MTSRIEEAIKRTVNSLKENSTANYIGLKVNLRQAVECLQVAMFPSYIGQDFSVCKVCKDAESCKSRSDEQRRTLALLKASEYLISTFSSFVSKEEAEKDTVELINKLPAITTILKTDIQAAYEGDPAATSLDEVILSYPAFFAISVYRIAHELYLMNLPVIPRMMTEYAHEITGIDIHPGATIGKYFFIDHGTGVVIGETTTVGEHVKLYQHVTLGAKSFETQPDGSLVKGIKRHPDIGNNVIIYAGATVLGGDTKIGNNCTIGSNVWITHSINDNQTVAK